MVIRTRELPFGLRGSVGLHVGENRNYNMAPVLGNSAAGAGGKLGRHTHARTVFDEVVSSSQEL